MRVSSPHSTFFAVLFLDLFPSWLCLSGPLAGEASRRHSFLPVHKPPSPSGLPVWPDQSSQSFSWKISLHYISKTHRTLFFPQCLQHRLPLHDTAQLNFIYIPTHTSCFIQKGLPSFPEHASALLSCLSAFASPAPLACNTPSVNPSVNVPSIDKTNCRCQPLACSNITTLF